MTRLGLTGVIAIASALAAPAYAQSGKKSAGGAVPENVAACPSAFPGGELVCSCEAGAVGSVWGSGPYTSDSNVCAAVRHSGTVPDGAGAVQLTEQPGQDSYEGSTANGVTTNSWGAYDKSFAVTRVGSAPAPAPTSDLAACTQLPAGAEFYACNCPANPRLGSVWGKDPFTADSDICTAALFTGYIDQDGGDVFVIRAPGLEAYAADESNGVSTSGWNAYEASIIFDWNK